MAQPGSRFELAVVIPVWNDAEGLGRLLPVLLAVPQITQIIVVDDASDVAFDPAAASFLTLEQSQRLIWLNLTERRGAGHARNIGMERVTADFVIFFDSDDLVLPEFEELLQDIDCERDFDFCMFRHVDSRMRARGMLQPLESDQFHWDMAGIGSVVTQIDIEQAARICRVSAYPWNKIYRTKFLRQNCIKCTEIMVHNDIELHWVSFFRANRILTSNRLCCEHFVEAGGSRLTNRTGAERLEVFEALEAMQGDLTSSAYIGSHYADAVIEFYLNLFHWILGSLAPDLHAKFKSKIDHFLRSSMEMPIVTLAALKDPYQILRLNEQLARLQ